MKNISVIIAGLSLFFFSMTGLGNTNDDSPTGAQKQTMATHEINLVSSPELNTLAGNWASEYAKSNPGIRINVGQSDQQSPVSGQISLTADDNSVKGNDQLWKMVVGRDAMVAFVNAANPMLDQLNKKGISADLLATLLADPAKRNWNSVVQNGNNAPLNIFVSDSEAAKTKIADFSGMTFTTTTGLNTASAAWVIASVQRDKYAIGFCNLTDVCEAGSNNFIQAIQLLPIDKNKNGRIDSFENIYTNVETFTRGVWVGKYPRALCGNIYAVSTTQPTDKNTVAFLTWVINQGQKYLNANGYSDLASAEIKSAMAALEANTAQNATKDTVASENKPLLSNIWMATLLFVVFSVLLVILVLRKGKKQNWTSSEVEQEGLSLLKEDALAAPKGLYFDKTHTWAFMEQDGSVKVGVDDFLQHVTGTLTRIIMKNMGDSVRKGDKLLTLVKDGKQLSIYAPISGTIVKQNTALFLDSSIINTAPYTEGWVYLIEPNNWAREIRFLFMRERYTEWIQDEFVRLKDFFAASASSKTPAFAQVILQDGGELTDHILADLEPEVWEDFQIKFINTSR